MSSYTEALHAFAQLVFDQKCGNQSPCGYLKTESQKKWDKLVLLVDGKEQTEFLINKATGMIYHAKSPVIPNLHRPYGTVYNASKWTWGGKGGTNISDETFVFTGSSYGGYKHYLPVGVTKAPRKVRVKAETTVAAE